MKRDRRDFLKVMTSCALTTSFMPWLVLKKPKPGVEGVSQKNRVKEALSLMQEYGSCCTGVLAAYAPEMGMEKELAARVGRGMAGGIGSLGNVCGTVSGAALVIGLKTTDENNIHDMASGFRTMETVKEFVARFEEQHSSIKCRELIGHDISTQEKREAAMKDNAFANCPKFVESAVTILDEIFNTEKNYHEKNRKEGSMIAYCGLDCSKCDGYIATQSGKEEELIKVADNWSKQYNADVKPEHVICDGCKAGKRQSYHCANACSIRKCCIKKQYNSCIDCDLFACSDLQFILDNVPEAKANLEKLRK